MRVYRDTVLNRSTGQRQRARKLTIEFHYRGRRKLAGFADKTASEQFGRKLQRLADLRDAGEPPTPELMEWIAHMPRRMREYVDGIGLLDSKRLSAARPLLREGEDDKAEPALLDEFKASLLARDGTERHVEQTVNRIQRVFDGCGFRFWHDIDALAVERYLRERRDGTKDAPGICAKTSNYLLQSARQFCGWMVRNGRASEDPLRVLRPINARTDVRIVRRALSAEELRKLIKAAAEGPSLECLPGPLRAMLYRLAAETGLRRAEFMSLRRSSFDFEADPPTVKLQAAYSKRRREDVFALRPDTARAFKYLLARCTPAALAFPVPKNWDAAGMIRADAMAAGILATNENGRGLEHDRVLDFHALRHSFITIAMNAGIPPKVVQKLARHSTITLTFDRYTHLRADDELRALEALPDLSTPPAASALPATGTDGLPAGEPLRSPACSGSSSDTDPSGAGRSRPREAASPAQEPRNMEAAPGLEPGITDLQSVALPLGYAAEARAGRFIGPRRAQRIARVGAAVHPAGAGAKRFPPVALEGRGAPGHASTLRRAIGTAELEEAAQLGQRTGQGFEHAQLIRAGHLEVGDALPRAPADVAARVAIPDAVQLAQDGRQGARVVARQELERTPSLARRARVPNPAAQRCHLVDRKRRRGVAPVVAQQLVPAAVFPDAHEAPAIREAVDALAARDLDVPGPTLEQPVGLPSEAPQECQFGRAVHELVVGVPLLLVACSERHRAHQRQLEREPRHVLGAAGPRSEVGRLLRESRHQAPRVDLGLEHEHHQRLRFRGGAVGGLALEQLEHAVEVLEPGRGRGIFVHDHQRASALVQFELVAVLARPGSVLAHGLARRSRKLRRRRIDIDALGLPTDDTLPFSPLAGEPRERHVRQEHRDTGAPPPSDSHAICARSSSARSAGRACPCRRPTPRPRPWPNPPPRCV